MITKEYFCTPDGAVSIRVGERMRNLSADDTDIINELLYKVEQDYPKAYAALEAEYGGQKYARWRMFRRFVCCNFGAFDHIEDVDAENTFHFEKVPCPLRGECKHECVICMPEFSTTLSAREYEILALIMEGLTDLQIADRICRSVDTVKNHRKNIRRKLAVHSNLELIEKIRKNNLV